MTMPVIVVLLGPLCDPGFVSDQDTHGLAVPDASPDRWPRAARPIPRVVDHDHHHASSAFRGLLLCLLGAIVCHVVPSFVCQYIYALATLVSVPVFGSRIVRLDTPSS